MPIDVFIFKLKNNVNDEKTVLLQVNRQYSTFQFFPNGTKNMYELNFFCKTEK